MIKNQDENPELPDFLGDRLIAAAIWCNNARTVITNHPSYGEDLRILDEPLRRLRELESELLQLSNRFPNTQEQGENECH